MHITLFKISSIKIKENKHTKSEIKTDMLSIKLHFQCIVTKGNFIRLITVKKVIYHHCC